MAGTDAEPLRARPRVLHVITLSEWGGAQACVLALARGMRDAFEICVACGAGGRLVQRLRQEGIRTVEIPALRRHPHPVADLVALWQLVRVMRDERSRTIRSRPRCTWTRRTMVKFEVVRQVAEEFRQRHQVIEVNGVRNLFLEGWGLIRASNTQRRWCCGRRRKRRRRWRRPNERWRTPFRGFLRFGPVSW